jgi:hypothetical protein
MFILSANSNSAFYTGRAGCGWVAPDKAEAFAYASRSEAERRAEHFNRWFGFHGLTFVAVPK